MEPLALVLGLASLSIALAVFLYPDIQSALERRDHLRRMSRRWREEQGQRCRSLSWSWPRRSKRRRHT